MSKSPIENRFFGKVEWSERRYANGTITTRCLEWTGKTTGSGKGGGYGQFCSDTSYPQKWVVAHRWLYERWVGPIDEGLQLDHLCLNRLCVNPTHLEPVPHRVNNARRVVARWERRVFAPIQTRARDRQASPGWRNTKTCRAGLHPWTPDNILSRGEGRLCRECQRLREVRRRVSKRTQQAAETKS